jgi:Mrr N-terminal domain
MSLLLVCKQVIDYNSNMKTLKVTDPTYERLLQFVTSFEDEPEDVIVRLMDQAESVSGAKAPSSQKKKSSRATPGSILPVREYWLPILETLEEAGGAAPSTEVIDSLEERMKDVLAERDREPLKSGEIRWRNRARFARLRMKERGLISDSSHRGVWAITPTGSAFLRLERKSKV